jgi:hypothetical protein
MEGKFKFFVSLNRGLTGERREKCRLKALNSTYACLEYRFACPK